MADLDESELKLLKQLHRTRKYGKAEQALARKLLSPEYAPALRKLVEDEDANQLLLVAARAGDEEVMRGLLKAGRGTEMGPWAFISAMREPNPDVAGRLLRAGVSARFKLDDGGTLLHLLGQEGFTGMVPVLMKHTKLDVNGRDEDRRTPLMHAAENGYADVARELLDAGADPSLKDRSGYSALDWATQYGERAVVKLLEWQRPKKAEAAPSAADWFQAVRRGNVKEVKAALAAGVNVNAVEPLSWDRKGRTRGGGMSALMIAAEEGHADVIRLLAQAGANVEERRGGDDDGFKPLHVAAEHGRADAITALLDAGARADARSAADITPLMLAAASGKATAVRVLLAKGADPLAESQYGQTPFDYAKGGRIIRILKSAADARAKAPRARRLSPHKAARPSLVSAIASGRAKRARELLDAGADPNERFSGAPILTHAVINHAVPIVALLLESGPDVNATDDEGKTPLDNAQHMNGMYDGNYQDVVDLLKRHGAKRSAQLAVRASRPRPVRQTTAKPAPPAPPDFTAAAASPAFRRVLAEVEKLTGVKGAPMDHVAGGVVLDAAMAKTEALLRDHQSRLLKKGAYVFRVHSAADSKRDPLGVLPTADPLDVIAAMRTDGSNYEKSNGDIVAAMREIGKTNPFVLTGAGWNFLRGRFLKPPSSSTRLARQLVELCPDLSNGSTAAVAVALRESREFFLWWD
jgi:ankyrin repeat protein